MLKPVVRIESDGTPEGTRVTSEDGTPIQYITDITVHMSVHEFVTAHLSIIIPSVSTLTEVNSITFECPCCRGSIQHECKF